MVFMFMVMSVAMIVTVAVAVMIVFRSILCEPESGYLIPNHTTQAAKLAEGISHAVLEFVRQREQQPHACAFHKRYSAEKYKE